MLIGLDLGITRPRGAGGGPSSLLTGLVSYWNLDEVSGQRADSLGTYNLTDNNTVGSATGKISNAADFIPANNEFLSGGAVDPGDVDFTFNGWVFPEGSGNRTVLSSWTAGQTGFELRADASSIPVFLIRNNADQVSWGVGISLNTWHMFTVWHDASANQIGIVLNAGTPVTAATTGAAVAKPNFWVGALAGTALFCDGRVDELGFWTKVLSATERTSLYNSGAGLTYPFVGA